MPTLLRHGNPRAVAGRAFAVFNPPRAAKEISSHQIRILGVLHISRRSNAAHQAAMIANWHLGSGAGRPGLVPEAGNIRMCETDLVYNASNLN